MFNPKSNNNKKLKTICDARGLSEESQSFKFDKILEDIFPSTGDEGSKPRHDIEEREAKLYQPVLVNIST